MVEKRKAPAFDGCRYGLLLALADVVLVEDRLLVGDDSDELGYVGGRSDYESRECDVCGSLDDADSPGEEDDDESKGNDVHRKGDSRDGCRR